MTITQSLHTLHHYFFFANVKIQGDTKPIRCRARAQRRHRAARQGGQVGHGHHLPRRLGVHDVRPRWLSQAGGLEVVVRGEATEGVTVLYAAAAAGFKIERKQVTVGTAGTASCLLGNTAS